MLPPAPATATALAPGVSTAAASAQQAAQLSAHSAADLTVQQQQLVGEVLQHRKASTVTLQAYEQQLGVMQGLLQHAELERVRMARQAVAASALARLEVRAPATHPGTACRALCACCAVRVVAMRVWLVAHGGGGACAGGGGGRGSQST